jgi:hypothetical protein
MARTANTLPTVEEIRQAFDYTPTTGDLSWRARPDTGRAARIFNNMGLVGKTTGCLNGCGYLRILWNRKHYVAHRLAWKHFYGREPQGELDHINGNRSDNRIANLREADTSQNCANVPLRKDNTSGLKGVRAYKGKYVASVRKDKKVVFYATFDTAAEAYEAYCREAKMAHGEFYNPG